MKTKLFRTNLLSLGILSAFSVTPLLVGGLSVNAQEAAPGMNEFPTQTAPGTVPNQTAPGTVPNQTAPGTVPNQTAPGVTPTQPGTLSNYSPETAPLLAMGTRGATVTEVQNFLRSQGLYNGSIDGIYGPQTRSAVMQFQQRQNLASDGIVGTQTWEAMLNQIQQQNAGV